MKTAQENIINKVFGILLIFSIVFIFFALTFSVNASTDPTINVKEDQSFKNASFEACFIPEGHSSRYSILLQLIDYEIDLYDDGSNQWTEYRLCLASSTGNQYHFITQDGDFQIGDFFTAVVDDNKTAAVRDDIILSLRYERPDLFNTF